MPVIRCTQCRHTAEIPTTSNSHLDCPACGAAQQRAWDTTLFIRKVLQQCALQQREIRELREQIPDTPASQTAESTLDALDLHNTSALSTTAQHQPLVDWFTKRQIKAIPNLQAVDTSGFFDEIAVEMGDNLPLLGDVLSKIRWGLQKDVPNFSIKLGDHSQKDGKTINNFCRRLYENTFLSKYRYQKQEKIVRASVQFLPAVRNFFNGEWLEWYALMKVLAVLQEKGRNASCTRNLKITFANEDLHELDVFFLLDGRLPVCIECKSGEFRQDIEKLLKLRKRLGLEREHCILCSPDLSDEQAAGLSSMYELTFTNPAGLTRHLQALL